MGSIVCIQTCECASVRVFVCVSVCVWVEEMPVVWVCSQANLTRWDSLAPASQCSPGGSRTALQPTNWGMHTDTHRHTHTNTHRKTHIRKKAEAFQVVLSFYLVSVLARLLSKPLWHSDITCCENMFHILCITYYWRITLLKNSQESYILKPFIFPQCVTLTTPVER